MDYIYTAYACNLIVENKINERKKSWEEEKKKKKKAPEGRRKLSTSNCVIRNFVRRDNNTRIR